MVEPDPGKSNKAVEREGRPISATSILWGHSRDLSVRRRQSGECALMFCN